MVERENSDDPVADEVNDRGTLAKDPSGSGRMSSAPPPATDVHAYIGRQLRAVYDDVAKQPIPDRFLALMQQLEAKGAG